MKVHPIKINFLIISRNYNKDIFTHSDISRFSADKVISSLDISGVYNRYVCLSQNSPASIDKGTLYISNPSFGSAKKPLYAIDKDGNYQKFEDRKSAQNALRMPIDGIDRCLQGKRLSSHGYGFVYADVVEKVNQSGERVIDCDKLSSKIKEILPVIQAEPKPQPFYAISLKDGVTQKFQKRSDAVKTLSISKENIAECLQGKRNYSHDYIFIYADELETTDNEGNSVLDDEKLYNKLDQVKSFINSLDKPVPVYAIDAKGNYKKYPSKKQAAKNTGVSAPSIIKCLNGELKKSGGYVFVLPEEIEKTTQNGSILIDKKKIDEVVRSSFKNSRAVELYAVDKNGVFQKFSGVRNAAKELALDARNISRCLNGDAKRCGGYMFIRADEVETAGSDNQVNIDIAKLWQLNEKSIEKDNCSSVYAVSPDGVWKKYPSIKQAALDTGMDSSVISSSLSKDYGSINGYSFVFAKDVEAADENGQIRIDYNVLKEKFEAVNKNSIYAVYKDGTYKKYFSISDAVEELGLYRSSISACINGNRGYSKAGGCVFVKANDVETFENGHVCVNKSLLGKFSAGLAETGPKSVYLFDSKGRYQRYDSAGIASDTLNLSLNAVKRCLSGKQSVHRGYSFFYGDNFERYDEKGNIIVDWDKLDETVYKINPAIKKLMDKYGKIYALRGVNVYEFDNIRKAARALEIDENSLIHILQTGHNSAYGQDSINGYVFTCEKDE